MNTPSRSGRSSPKGIRVEVQSIVREVVRSVRGPRSQADINRKLGYGSNQMHRWEKGGRVPSWRQFVRLCQLCRVNLAKPMQNALHYSQPLYKTNKLVVHLIGGRNLKEAAEVTDRSVSTASRWIDGTSEPDLCDVMMLAQLSPGGLETFINRFCEENQLPLPSSIRQMNLSWPELALEFPFSGGLLAALELRKKAHEPAWLTRILGVNEEQLAECIEAFVGAGLLIEKDGRLEPADGPIDISGYDVMKRMRMRVHWYRLLIGSLERGLVQPGNRNQLKFFLHGVSHQAYDDISEAVVDCYQKVDQILRADKSRTAERLVYLGLDLADLDDITS